MIFRKSPGFWSGVFLWAEFLVLFAGGPLLILAYRKPGILFLLLWSGGFITYRLSRPAVPAPLPDLRTILRRLALIAPFRIGLGLMLVTAGSTTPDMGRRRMLAGILGRFAVLGLLLTLATRVFAPEMFFSLPRQRPVLWAAIMALYPLLSVWPQEVIYRRFLRRRYAPLFGENFGFILASAIAFGFAHIIFLHWFPVVLTLAGGAMFADSYTKHQSLGLACLEHALYGCLIFTIGLGNYFYTGAAWR